MFLLWQGLFGVPGSTQAGYFSLIGYWIGGGGTDGGGPPGSADDWIIRFRRRRGR